MSDAPNPFRDAASFDATIAAPPEMPIERMLELLAKEADVDGFHALRRRQVFKIGVNFDPDSLKNRTQVTKASTAQKVEVNTEDAQFFRALQTPLPLIERPFDELARGVDASGDELVEFADGHENDLHHLAKDVSAFLMWTAEPKMMARKQAGFVGVLFLTLLSVLLYLTNKRIWAPVKGKKSV